VGKKVPQTDDVFWKNTLLLWHGYHALEKKDKLTHAQSEPKKVGGQQPVKRL